MANQTNQEAMTARDERANSAPMSGRDGSTPTGTLVSADALASSDGHALREQDGWLDAFFNDAAVGIAVLTPEARFTQVNDTYCRIVGYTRNALEAMDCAALTHPDDLLAMNEQIAALLAGRIASFVIEKRYRRGDGALIWVRDSVSLTRGAEGQPLHLIALCQDITEDKRTEEALRAREAQLATELDDLSLLQQISSQLIQEGNLDALYEQILDAAIAVTHADMGSIQMLYPERGALRLLAWKGFDPRAAAFWDWVRQDATTSCGKALQSGERVIVTDAETCDFMADTQDLDYYHLSGIVAVQSTPLLSRTGRLVGMISTHWRTQHQPTERDFQLLDTLARQAADLIERARNDEALRAGEERQSFLLALADRLRPLTDPRQIQQAACEMLGARLAVARVAYGEVDPDNGDMLILENGWTDGTVPDLSGRFPFATFGGESAAALLRGEDVTLDDYLMDRRFGAPEVREFLRRYGIRSGDSAMIVKEERLAGLLFVHGKKPRRWTSGEHALLREVAERTWEAVERAHAEEALRKSEERRQLALDAAASGAFVWYVAEDRGEPDAQMLRLFGLPLDGDLNLAVALAKLIHPDDRARYAAAVAQAADPTGGGVLYEDIRVIRPDGSERWLTISGQVFFAEENGAPRHATRMAGTATDITERKQMERMLAEQNYLLEGIVAGCQLEDCLAELTRAISRLQPHMRAAVLLADDARETFDAIVAADIPPTFGQGLQGAPINEQAIGACGAALYHGEPITCTDIAHDDRGSQMWRELCLAHGILACHSEPVLGANGVTLASLMLCLDEARAPTDWELRIAHSGAHIASIVIERDRAERAMQESEEKFRMLADNVQQLTWMARPDGHIFWYNRRWYDYTGATPESQEGWGWQSVHDPEVLPAVLEQWRHSIATGEPLEMVFPLRGSDGVFRPFLTLAMPMKDAQGRVVRWFGTNTDVTAQRDIEEALRAASQAKDDFLGIASHELRTPLTSATANVQLAERSLRALTQSGAGAASDDGRSEGRSEARAADARRRRLENAYQLLARTDRQMVRMNRLVGDLIDVSRIQAGKLDLYLERCDLLTILREAVQEQREAWPERTITLSLPRRPSLPIEADADRIGQVVTNFLTNALKYSQADQSVAIRVREQNGQARVEVRDQGPGLSAEQQESLFERFYRAPGVEQLSGSGVGLGLGLYISKTIVERHGGAVGVESAPGAGSAFWFTLPMTTETDA